MIGKMAATKFEIRGPHNLINPHNVNEFYHCKGLISLSNLYTCDDTWCSWVSRLVSEYVITKWDSFDNIIVFLSQSV